MTGTIHEQLRSWTENPCLKDFARKTGDHLCRVSATEDHLWIHPHYLPVFDDYLIEIEVIA